MFFQVNITPKEKKVAETQIQDKINTNYSLLLAPFQPPTRIKLDTKINTSIQCQLTIKNSNSRSLTVSITRFPPQERCLSFGATEWCLQPESNVVLDIIWEPNECGCWRDILQLSDSRRIKYDVPLTLTCVNPNKTANDKRSIIKRRIPLVKKRAGSISQKENKKCEKFIHHNNKIEKTSKVNHQSALKRIRPENVKTVDKENFSNNIDCNWMLEQAKAKKQKKDNLPSQTPLNFSKFLDSSVFKFTPMKSKFSCFQSSTIDEFKVETSQQGIGNPNISWIVKQEDEVKLTLRKETYVKIPKYLHDLQSKTINKDNQAEEFDDSLSPKTSNVKITKSPSDISLLMNNIKFTPLKNSCALNKNELKLSPSCCSMNNKIDISKSFSFDSDNDTVSKNATFDIDSTYDSVGNNTYELPLSPTDTKTSSQLKPMCLANRFNQNDFNTCFSTPLRTNSHCNTTNDFARFSNQFSKSQVDSCSVKDCLEANLWVKSKNVSLSPISKSIMNSTLHSTIEENTNSTEEKRNIENCEKESKNAEAFCIEISPPLKEVFKKPSLRKVSPTKNNKIIKDKTFANLSKLKKTVQLNNSKNNKRMQIPNVRISKLSLASLVKSKTENICKTVQKQSKEISVKLHDPNDFLSMFCNPDPFAATMTVDPFLASTLYYDDKWIYKQEMEFKKWLNALLTPPEHLTDIESITIDIGKIWQSSRTKEDLTLAETKESVSARYHTDTRLNTLRKAACAMYHKPDVINALSQTTVAVEKEILILRQDKDLHRDIGLQKIILELFISYNPLWLRIGLETIYGETIPLQSNSDIIGLSRFLLNRFFSDPFLVKTHSSHAHPNIRLSTFQVVMNKFMLKKFLFLIYFLDYAKRNQLIGHDPCLFRKKALIKDSKSILLTFSRELLSGIGDITKVLRNYHYTVSHKQTYLDEYDYAVINLCVDLRDGVKLCRVMELVTGKRCLTCRCRVPAISRLQKVHNVNIALVALKEAGYIIKGDIDAKAIADGHKEKTLSLLWQIIYKFQAPKFNMAAKILQRWWRSKLWYIYIKNILKDRRNNAARVIQKMWRCYIARRKLQALRKAHAEDLEKRNNAAQKIQLYWKLSKKVQEEQTKYLNMKASVFKIQKWWKRNVLSKPYRNAFKRNQQLIVMIQRRWRANKLMRSERIRFMELKANTIKIQILWKARRLGRQVCTDYRRMKAIVVFVQNKWRAKLLMKTERSCYLQKLGAIDLIQKWWKRRLLLNKDRKFFIALKKAVRCIEKAWISKHFIPKEKQLFLLQKNSAKIIQKTWRNYIATKNDVLLFNYKRNSCVKVQSWWRSVATMKKYKKQRIYCIKLQIWWRSVLLTRKEHYKFLLLKQATLIIQKNWKMQLRRRSYRSKKISVMKIEAWYRNLILSRSLRYDYLKMKTAVKTIEGRWIALKTGMATKAQYCKTKALLINLQRRWRAQIFMKKVRQEFLRGKCSAIKIQSWWKMVKQRLYYKELLRRLGAARVLQKRWKAFKRGKQDRAIYAKNRACIIFVQRKWRANLLAKSDRIMFLRKRKSAIIVQKYWRSFVVQREFRKKKNAVRMIEDWRIHGVLGRKIRSEFLKFRSSIVQIQRLWRVKKRVKEFRRIRKSAILLQNYWRSYNAQKEYKRKKSAAIVIQRWRRHIVMGRNTESEFLYIKECVVKIQRRWKTYQQMIRYRNIRHSAIIIQKHWKRVLAVREYDKKKIAVLFIENWMKHILFGRQKRMEFLQRKTAVISIQRLVRTKLQVKQFRRLRDAAIKIQRSWRSVLRMRECKLEYERKRITIIALQRRYRARKAAILVRQKYCSILFAITVIQKWWRKILYSRQLEILKAKRKAAVVTIENWWLKASEIRRIREAVKAEFRRKNQAATKIQAIWRGFRVRQTASKKMSILRERAKKAEEAAIPSATLAVRLQENIEIFKYATNIGQLSICLSSLDVITRLSPKACINVCQLNLVSKLYDILTRANRSLPWLDVCLKNISILLTLAKFEPTKVYVLKSEYIEDLARLLTISVDKREDLFLHTATLMWILTENEEYTEDVQHCSRTKYLLTSLYSSISKRLNRNTSVITKYKEDDLPSPKPDWGLKHKRPRIFISVLQAITALALRLKISSIAHAIDMQRSFTCFT